MAINLVKIKKRLKWDLCFYTILQILRVRLYVQVPIFQALPDINYKDLGDSNCKQMDLLDLQRDSSEAIK